MGHCPKALGRGRGTRGGATTPLRGRGKGNRAVGYQAEAAYAWCRIRGGGRSSVRANTARGSNSVTTGDQQHFEEGRRTRGGGLAEEWGEKVHKNRREGERRHQQTIAKPFTLSGVGLHSGRLSEVTVRPARARTGRVFLVSVSEPPTRIRAHVSHAEFPATLATVLQSEPSSGADASAGAEKIKIHLTEHLLSALEGCGVNNCVVEIKPLEEESGADRDRGGEAEPTPATSSSVDLELPILDGSSLPWAEEILRAGLVDALDQEGKAVHLSRTAFASTPTHFEHDERSCLENQQRLQEEEQGFEMPFTVTQRSGGGGDEDNVSFVSFYPGGSVTRVSYGIDFVQKARVIGRQWYSWSPDLEKEDDDDGYVNQIAPARTFCCSQDIPLMRDMGLIRGGSEECAMIANGSEWVDPSKVRFHHEQARHKILDLVGDLALVAQGGNAALPLGHIVAYKAGHNLHLKFAKELVKRIDRLHKDKEQTINLD